MSSLADIFNFSSQVPNWAPNERFLPNADYGRVGALKLVDNVFRQRLANYAYQTGNNQWSNAGRYHFYLLGRNMEKLENEKKRVGLNAAPGYGDFLFGAYDYEIERDGPFHFSRVVSEIAEASRIYGFSPQVLSSAVLTHLHGLIVNNTYPGRIAGFQAELQEGANIARYNFALLEALWGVRASGYPATMSNRAVAARKDYGGKGKRNGGKRRNGGRMKRRRF